VESFGEASLPLMESRMAQVPGSRAEIITAPSSRAPRCAGITGGGAGRKIGLGKITAVKGRSPARTVHFRRHFRRDSSPEEARVGHSAIVSRVFVHVVRAERRGEMESFVSRASRGRETSGIAESRR